MNNFDTERPFGTLSLATALQFSVNSVFCNIGLALGAKRILKQAKKFGFYERPPLETPESERLASGLYRKGSLYDPKRDSDVDAGRMAFGQERLLVTPEQMAMVAGTIGNDGILMRPFVVEKIVTPNGKTRTRTKPTKIRRAVTPATARDVEGDDDPRRPGRYGHGRADPRARDRRQDRHRRDGGRREQHDVVHRLRRRPGREAASSRSRSCSRTSRSPAAPRPRRSRARSCRHS